MSSVSVQKQNFKQSPGCTGLWLLGLLLMLIYSANQVRFQSENQTKELVAPPPGLEHFTFGFRHTMADLIWVRALQDFDFCDQPLKKHLCQGKGWLFHALDTATDLDPEFRMAYLAGSVSLTVIVSDYEGASALFDKGVGRFPGDWKLAYSAAYHALYEENNIPKAAGLMELAAKNGAPNWVYVLAGRLYTDAGRRELAEGMLAQIQAAGLPESYADRLRQKIKEGPSKPNIHRTW